ncbi:uncharacterized protein DS421_14g467930 [Arachis hypogaea]|nr:uncharacterized protein DS421_14g467930 [Arachis hypogaea]
MLKIRHSRARDMPYINEDLGDKESDKQSVNGQRLSGAGEVSWLSMRKRRGRLDLGFQKKKREDGTC